MNDVDDTARPTDADVCSALGEIYLRVVDVVMGLVRGALNVDDERAFGRLLVDVAALVDQHAEGRAAERSGQHAAEQPQVSPRRPRPDNSPAGNSREPGWPPNGSSPYSPPGS